ncbi:hypothetical protein HWV03_08615 [Moritella sp. 36]|nr:hypothetical protein [Moritella sp. 36]QUM88855.1 hypothetical protein HWV03_08615 [Moritella sp. 36]
MDIDGSISINHLQRLPGKKLAMSYGNTSVEVLLSTPYRLNPEYRNLTSKKMHYQFVTFNRRTSNTISHLHT